MKHYKGNQKGLIEFANGVTAPNGKVYNYLCQCANPDRYILVNNPNFNCTAWSSRKIGNPDDSFVSAGMLGTKMQMTGGGSTFELSPDVNMVETPTQTATSFLEGKAQISGDLNRVKTVASVKFYQIPVNKNGI